MNLNQVFFRRCILGAFLAVPYLANAANTYTLQQVIDLAFVENPSVKIAKAQEEAAIAGVTTARSYLNPEIELGTGPSRYRTAGHETKNNWGVALSQPLEFSDVRAARREVAESNLKGAGVNTELNKVELRARLKMAFYDVLHRQATLRLVEDDRQLLNQIKERIKLRVDIGESPRYELIKADTEALAAERDYQTASIKVIEAKAYLQRLIGASMPADYSLAGELPLTNSLPSVEVLRGQISQSPHLQQLRVASQTAEAKLKLEQNLRNPGLTLKAGVEQDPDLTSLRLGLAIPLPVWNQRQGQIAEASANISQMQAMLSDRELAVNRDLESAYQRYLIAKNQLATFENGLLKQAESVLNVAESAYRFGERGILEYLDAQRTYRSVKKDYLSARFDYVTAMLEVERLLGSELLSGAESLQDKNN